MSPLPPMIRPGIPLIEPGFVQSKGSQQSEGMQMRESPSPDYLLRS